MRISCGRWLLLAAAIFGLGIAATATARAQELRVESATAAVDSADAAIRRWNDSLRDAADSILTGTVEDDAQVEARKGAVTVEKATAEPVEAMDAAQNLPVSSAAQDFGVRSRAMARLEQLQPMIEPILLRQGVPRALLAVVLIESGGRIEALSPKGALGIWQLMPETARRYGLEVSGDRDERLNPAMATRAAARYLHELYGQFHDWQLVLAAYNAGENAVQEAMRQAQSNSFDTLSKLRLLPAETRDYVPAVLRASKAFGPLRIERTQAHPPAATEPSAAKSRVQFALAAFDSTIRNQGTDSFAAPAGAAPRSE